MTQYNQDTALHEIFWENEKALSPKMYVYRQRLVDGTLSQKTIDTILKDNGFVLWKPAIYKKTQK